MGSRHLRVLGWVVPLLLLGSTALGQTPEPAPEALDGTLAAPEVEVAPSPLRPLTRIQELVGLQRGQRQPDGTVEWQLVHDIAYVKRGGRVLMLDYLAERPDGTLIATYGERLPDDEPLELLEDVHAGQALIVDAVPAPAGVNPVDHLLAQLGAADGRRFLAAQGIDTSGLPDAEIEGRVPAAGRAARWLTLRDVTLAATPDGRVVTQRLRAVVENGPERGQLVQSSWSWGACEGFIDVTCGGWNCSCPGSPPCTCPTAFGACIKWFVHWCGQVATCPPGTSCPFNPGITLICRCK